MSCEDMEAAGYGDEKTVHRKVSLLKLPKIIQHWISEGRLKPSVGYNIVSIKDKDLIIAVARRTMTERLSHRAVLRILKDMRDRGIYAPQRSKHYKSKK